MDLNIDDELVTKYYDAEEERKKFQEAVKDRIKQEAIEEGIRQGLEKGIQEGVQKNQQEIILNMYNSGLDIESISKYVNLSILDIEKIINQNKKN